MPGSKVIEIILVDGIPSGIRVVTIANWAGVALASSREDMPRFLDREELERPALYFLTGKDTGGNVAIYVGESDSFKARIRGHDAKTFWDQAIVLTSMDGRFNKATVKHLEAEFYNGMLESGRVVVMNTNHPRGVSLGESDVAIADEYRLNARIVLGVLGFVDIDMPRQGNTEDLETPEDTPTGTGESTGDLLSRFWTALLDRARGMTPLHAGRNTTRDGWIASSAGLPRGLSLGYVVRQHDARVELYINDERPGRNKQMFDRLLESKVAIEAVFGGPIGWDRLNEKRACRIKADVIVSGWRDEARWQELHNAMIDAMIRLDRAIRPHVADIDGIAVFRE